MIDASPLSRRDSQKYLNCESLLLYEALSALKATADETIFLVPRCPTFRLTLTWLAPTP